ncbi:hypothetical protein [Microbacterium sp. Root180]|uniref:hypothetical protein n=1 Tax=Microbacterium sp. Root180 TaxID=1736483 RepID=UPI00070066AA|nr:hypothetical protein [Microbacterium sp. Root180]KRB38950.1 hypothetical protein ASD93_03180 [Microbacterium sp. Root180]
MFGKDQRDPLERALEGAAGLKAGTWESVETLSMLAIEISDRPEARELVARARAAAESLKSGAWDGTRALVWLARAIREVG